MPSTPAFLHAENALFLDFDGTLVDIAERPDEVVVLPGLVELLTGLADRLGGALAIVTGRSIVQIDAYLAPLCLPVAGVHGAERRSAQGDVVRVATPSLIEAVILLDAFVADHPGLLLERKPEALALHYRMAPEWEAACQHAMALVCADLPGMALMAGKMVIELKPASASKATALQAYLLEAPFIGRQPVFVGDDFTDEDGFAAVQSLGGTGIKIDDGVSLASHRLPSTSAFRSWLVASARALGARPVPLFEAEST